MPYIDKYQLEIVTLDHSREWGHEHINELVNALDDAARRYFDQMVRLIYQRIEINEVKSWCLADLRETLLPTFLSIEIERTEIEAEAEGVM